MSRADRILKVSLSLGCALIFGCGDEDPGRPWPAEVTVAPSELAFDVTTIGQARTLTVDVTSRGGAPVELRSVVVEPANAPFEVAVEVEPRTILAGRTVGVEVTYRPCLDEAANAPCSCVVGEQRATLVLGFDGNLAEVRIPLAGQSEHRARLALDPADLAPFTSQRSRWTVDVAAVGCGKVVVHNWQVTGPNGDESHSSVDDFHVSGWSESGPWAVCGVPQEDCPARRPVQIEYQNNDASQTDLAELRFNWGQERSRLVLTAEGPACDAPRFSILSSSPACLQAPIELSPSLLPDLPGTLTWTYQMRFAPAPATELSWDDAGRAVFVPELVGLYVVEAQARRPCGAEGEALAMISVIRCS